MAAHRTLTCSCCGKVIDLDHYDIRKPSVKQMVQQNVCFECLFWKAYVDNPIAGTYIVNGKLMYFVPIRGWLRKSTRLKKGIVYARDMKTGEAVANMERQIIGTVHSKNFFQTVTNSSHWIYMNVSMNVNQNTV